MWFKQIQVFQIHSSIPKENALEEQLEKLEFEPCRANTQETSGWIAPLDEDDDYFVHAYNNYLLFCLQTEEKIIPTYVLRQELKEKLKELEATEGRKISPKEKYTIKDQIYRSLLPQAFSRLTKIYAYFDVTNKRLIINTTNAKKTEMFISMLQKTIDNIAIAPLPLKKLHTIMTNWILKDNCPNPFCLEDACVLKDPNMANKVIRFNGQDLYSDNIKTFLQDGYKVDKVVVNWKERVTFALQENFTLSAIKYTEKVIDETKDYAAETSDEEFAADFIIMSETVNLLLNDLLRICEKKSND